MSRSRVPWSRAVFVSANRVLLSKLDRNCSRQTYRMSIGEGRAGRKQPEAVPPRVVPARDRYRRAAEALAEGSPENTKGCPPRIWLEVIVGAMNFSTCSM